MDQGTIGVDSIAMDHAKHAAAIEKEIESIRSNLDGLIAELDNRRRRLGPAHLARRHPSIVAVTALALLAGGVLVYRVRQRQRHSWRRSTERLRSALDRLPASRPPEPPPSVALKALTAVITGLAVFGGKRLGKRLGGHIFGRE